MRLSQEIRFLKVVTAIIIWMTLGSLFNLDPESYMLVGVPITILFQLIVARRPLLQLWLHPSFPIKWSAWIYPVALTLALPPTILLSTMIWHKTGSIPERLWCICGALGSIPSALCLINARWKVWKSFAEAARTAGVMSVFIFTLIAISLHGWKLSHDFWDIFFVSFVLYVPISFTLEEVFFRGCLDSYIYQEGDRYFWLSSVLISFTWGVWHMPTMPLPDSSVSIKVASFIALSIALGLIHCIYGIPLTLAWRRGGSLLAPAMAHALMDSFRNALLS